MFFCLFLACASGLKIQDNPYIAEIEKHGDLKRTFWQDQPPDPELLIFDTCVVVIEYPIKVWYFYIPPKFRPGALQLSVTDTSSERDCFCLEFEVDGLTTFKHKTLYRIGIFSQKDHRQLCLYTSLPIEGTRGLRAVQITAFIPFKYVKKADFILVQVMDVLTGKTKEGVISLKGGETR